MARIRKMTDIEDFEERVGNIAWGMNYAIARFSHEPGYTWQILSEDIDDGECEFVEESFGELGRKARENAEIHCPRIVAQCDGLADASDKFAPEKSGAARAFTVGIEDLCESYRETYAALGKAVEWTDAYLHSSDGVDCSLDSSDNPVRVACRLMDACDRMFSELYQGAFVPLSAGIEPEEG